MIAAADPDQKDAAHITLRGPYAKHQDAAYLPVKMENAPISITDANCFFEGNQNTVFLECGSPLIERNWNMKSYKGYHPHITIYDGKDRAFAQKLLSTLKQNRLYLTVTAGEVVPVQSTRGQGAMKLGMEGINVFLRDAIGRDQTWDSIANMADWQRLNIVDRLCSRLKTAAYYSAELRESAELSGDPLASQIRIRLANK
jgi:hypothetical protein